MSHMDTRMSWEPDKPHEECGVFGMYDLDATMLHHQFTTDCLRYSIVDRKAVVLPYQILLDLERLTF